MDCAAEIEYLEEDEAADEDGHFGAGYGRY